MLVKIITYLHRPKTLISLVTVPHQLFGVSTSASVLMTMLIIIMFASLAMLIKAQLLSQLMQVHNNAHVSIQNIGHLLILNAQTVVILQRKFNKKIMSVNALKEHNIKIMDKIQFMEYANASLSLLQSIQEVFKVAQTAVKII